jgi:5'-3' exonuclease
VRAVLFDGTFELFRAFYGSPGAEVARREVGAARGLLRGLAAFLRREPDVLVAVAFDHVIESFRNDLYAGYKTGDGIEPSLLAQFELAERVAAALGIVVWPMIEYEADDALATAARVLAGQPAVERVVIASPDKDLCQVVVGDRIVTWDRIRDRTFDETGVRERLGVAPASVPDYLALVGDDADGIPGVPRWGARSASTVLERYGHLEVIPADPEAWDVKVRGAAALAASLHEHRDDALLFRRLATLRVDVPLDASVDALRWRGADDSALRGVCAELGVTTPDVPRP